MSEQLEAKGTIVLTSDKPAPIESGVANGGQLISFSPQITFRRVHITKVDGLPDAHHESSDIEVAKKAADLCKIAGIRRSIVAKHLHDGHGYDLIEMETEQPFKDGDENLIEDIKIGESGFVSYEVIEVQTNRLLPGQTNQPGLVVLSQTLDTVSLKKAA